MGYGVIGSTSDSGSFSLGSSPGTPAKRLVHLSFSRKRYRPRSSSGLGRRPLTAVTPVQIRYGVQIRSELRLGAFLRVGAQSSQVRRALAASAQNMNLGSTRSIYEPVAGIFKRTVAR